MTTRAVEPLEQRRTRVPFLDLAPIHAPLRAELDSAVAGVVSAGAFVNGPDVAAFEADFAAYCGTSACVGVASGHDALKLILRGLRIGPGDEVVLPAYTFVATAEAVLDVGARPVLADVADTDRNLDPAAAEAAVGPRTRALLPVHLHGQLADMQAFRRLATRRGVALVEDACQAHGATRGGLRAGAAGDAAAFSFYPAKNLGAFGDAGAITTRRETLAETCRALREHGQAAKYDHRTLGYTARLDSIQAAVLRVKLAHLDTWNDARAAVAERYAVELDGVGDLVLPPAVPDGVHAWHLFVVETADPDELARSLAERGVGSGRHYPVPLHLTPALAGLGHRAGEFPVAERLAARGLSLPIFPGMTEEQVEAVVAAVRAFFDRRDR